MAIATGTAIAAAALGTTAGSIAGGMVQAGAQEKIAREQQAAAERMRQEALQFAAPTSKELENIQKQVDLYSKMYAQQTQMLDQVQKQLVDTYGPAILEQGKQYYKQLQGEASGVVKSFDNQRSRQREQLRQQLLDRMGPDALTSSAGVNALNDFDQKTADMRSGIEEQSLNNAITRLGGLQQAQGAGTVTALNSYNSMSNLLENIQRGMGNIQLRQTQAAMGTAAPVIGTAGSQFVGQAYAGQAIQGASQQLGQLAGQAMFFGSMQTPTPTMGEGQAFGGEGFKGSDFLTQPEVGFQRPSYNDRFTFGEFNMGE